MSGRLWFCALAAPWLVTTSDGQARVAPPPPAPPAATPAQTGAAPLLPPANGAIFQVSQGYSPLTYGMRAGAVGDVLTIQLVERTQGTTSNNSGTERASSIGLLPPTTGPLSIFGASDASLGGSGSFDGRGSSAQTHSLTGEISVTVIEVRANGTLVVSGEKHVQINRGRELVRISGIVRPADISSDNRVLSTRVADAQINFSGRGEIARAGRQGWLQRFFSVVSPF